MVVLDFGGLKDGYGSDTTRTVHVGEPTDEEREVFEIVRRAQQAGFEAVRPGVACQEIDRAARKVIADAGYGEYFIHRVGHGIGLTTHEPPYMVEGETHPIEPGHVLLDRARHLPARPLRRPHRGHRRPHRGRRPAPQQHATTSCGSSPDGGRSPPRRRSQGAAARPRRGADDERRRGQPRPGAAAVDRDRLRLPAGAHQPLPDAADGRARTRATRPACARSTASGSCGWTRRPR